jgi:hypothetical protein
VSFATLSQHLNNNQKEILRKEYDQQGKKNFRSIKHRQFVFFRQSRYLMIKCNRY